MVETAERTGERRKGRRREEEVRLERRQKRYADGAKRKMVQGGRNAKCKGKEEKGNGTKKDTEMVELGKVR